MQWVVMSGSGLTNSLTLKRQLCKVASTKSNMYKLVKTGSKQQARQQISWWKRDDQKQRMNNPNNTIIYFPVSNSWLIRWQKQYGKRETKNPAITLKSWVPMSTHLKHNLSWKSLGFQDSATLQWKSDDTTQTRNKEDGEFSPYNCPKQNHSHLGNGKQNCTLENCKKESQNME